MAEKEKTSAKPFKLVVGIDFGTTYSGYAYSTIQQNEKNKLDITLNKVWDSGVRNLSSEKTSTTLLLDKNGKFIAFGYEAEKQFEDILLDDRENKCNYKYFQRFKMNLYNTKPNLNMIIKDSNGIEHSALDVFSKSLEYLKDDCLKLLKGHGQNFKLEDIKWCVTVPAIGTDEAKMFMRAACEKIGIPGYRLQIVLEPEVASLYYQTWFSKENDAKVLKPGTKCLVIDLGGGTVDICGHEILQNGHLKQICKSVGNNCGGTTIDTNFLDLMKDILGTEQFKKFENEETVSFMNLLWNFESEKRSIRTENKGIMNLTIPKMSLDGVSPNNDFSTTLRRHDAGKDMHIVNEKMRIQYKKMEDMFNKVAQNIILTIEKAMKQTKDITVFFLVGGFAESELIRKAIESKYQDKEIISPPLPTLAVVKGAVIYGHRPDVVTTRVTQFAYGRKIKPVFQQGIHEEKRKVKVDDQFRCDGVFELLMKAGTHVPVGTKISKSYHTISKKQDKIRIALYKSTNDQSKYIDDPACEKVGECSITVPNPTDSRRFMEVDFVFGETELNIVVPDTNTKENFRLE